MHHQRTVLWRGLDTFSAEYCGLWQTDDGWRIEGTVLLSYGLLPARVQYHVSCDATWATHAVEVSLREGEQERVLRVMTDERHHWWVDGHERPDLVGCSDIDLSITPATNTLPIRRLRLQPGESAAVTAAWVRFPALTMEPLVQQYTRLTEHEYRYETTSGFRTHLDVDDLGLVRHYPDGWERVATTAESSK